MTKSSSIASSSSSSLWRYLQCLILCLGPAVVLSSQEFVPTASPAPSPAPSRFPTRTPTTSEPTESPKPSPLPSFFPTDTSPSAAPSEDVDKGESRDLSGGAVFGVVVAVLIGVGIFGYFVYKARQEVIIRRSHTAGNSIDGNNNNSNNNNTGVVVIETTEQTDYSPPPQAVFQNKDIMEDVFIT